MENTPKNFALQLGSLITLYISIGALISLLFAIITIEYPDAAQGIWEYESASTSIRVSIAMLIVFFPAYLVVTRLVNNINREADGVYLALTKWLIYLSLLVGGGVLLGDFVTIIINFLNGELTTRFILKALVVFVVVGIAFTYYILDTKGYWKIHEKKSIQYAGAMALIVLVSLVFGFRHTETPSQVREIKIDNLQINDLQMLQSRIEEHYRLKTVLPETLTELYTGLPAPLTQEGRTPYSYNVLSTTRYELCAEFMSDSVVQQGTRYAEPVTVGDQKNPYTWDYRAGTWCFERIVVPQNQEQQIPKIY